MEREGRIGRDGVKTTKKMARKGKEGTRKGRDEKKGMLGRKYGRK